MSILSILGFTLVFAGLVMVIAVDILGRPPSDGRQEPEDEATSRFSGKGAK